jgi:spermidine synthase
MTSIPGILIHRSHDEYGTIEVIEDGGQRSLHFGSDPKQSSMFLHDPWRLALSYTRAMMAPLLFNPQPQRILLLGLGGGSLAKFLLHHIPDCHIDAVELREKVVKLAYGYFQLPEDERLNVVIDDASVFVRMSDHTRFSNYDLILVDAFEAKGISRSVCGISFYDHCRERLASDGLLSMNLWSGDFITARDLLQSMNESFSNRVIKLPVEGKENIIGIAHRSQSPKQALKRLDYRARELRQQLDIEYPAFLKTMKRVNRWPFA